MDILNILAQATIGRDEAEGRLQYPMYGVAKEVNDPNGLGRIRARLDGQGKDDSSHWLLPMWPGAVEGIPRVGDPVVIWFVMGDPARGMYACHPSSRTLGRATEWMALGTSIAGAINDIITKHNALRAKVDDHIDKYNNHLHTETGATTLGPSLTLAAIGSGNDATKVRDAGGATVADNTTGPRVLSGEAKVR